METLPILNKSNSVLRIMLEPLAQAYEIAPGSELSIRARLCDNIQELKVEFWDDNFLAIWVPGKVTVELDGVTIAPIRDI